MLIWINAQKAARGEGSRSYGATRVETHLAGLCRPAFAIHIETDGMNISEVAEVIARIVGIEIGSPRTLLRQRTRRLKLTLRHIL